MLARPIARTASPWRARPLAGLLRALRAAGLIALVLWGGWIATAWLLLSTPLLRSLINEKAEKVSVEYESASSLVPGVVHLRGLIVTGQDRGLQWQLRLDRATARIALGDLFHRTFHATRVRASGASFALRRRLLREQGTADRLRGVPIIDRFGPVAIKEEGPIEVVPDWDYDSWATRIDDAEVRDVRFVWIQQTRIDRIDEVAGSFELHPMRQWRVDRLRARAGGATMTAEGLRSVEALRGELRTRVGPVDPRSMTGRSLMRTMDIDLSLRGTVLDAGAVARAFGAPQLIAGGTGPLSVEGQVQAGQVLPGSDVRFELQRVRVRAGRAAGTASGGVISYAVPSGPSPHEATGRIELRDVQLGPPGREQAVRIGAFRALLRSEPFDFAEPAPPRHVAVDVEDGASDDLRSTFALLAPHATEVVHVHRGSAAFSGSVAGPPDHLEGKAHVLLTGAQAEARGVRVRSDVRVDARIAAFDPRRGGDLSYSTVRVRRARLVNADGQEDTAPDWWGDVQLPWAQLRFGDTVKGPRATLFDADLRARCRDGRPLVGLYVRRSKLPQVVAGIFAMDDLSVRGSALVGRGWAALRDLSASGDGASIRAALRVDRGGKRGAALLKWRGVPVGIGVSESGTTVRPLVTESWFMAEQSKVDPGTRMGQLPRAQGRTPPRRTPEVPGPR